jgi:NAD(P)-dependent dehydrogenase (short-subunit alcohol dehydrogenase family)
MLATTALANDRSPAATLNHKCVLITGAASGLGRAFFEYYAKIPTLRVMGIDVRPWPEGVPTFETPSISNVNTGLPSSDSGISPRFMTVDITDEAALQRFAEATVTAQYGAFDLVVHSAGIRGLVPSIEAQRPHDVAAAETIEAMDLATMRRTYEINTLGTFSLIKVLLPSLRRAAAEGRSPKFVTMSSRMGSISYNTTGGGYAYRASKAALNAIVKSFSIDVPEVCFACVHPGRVETGLVKIKEEGAISPQESLKDMIPIINQLGADQGLQSGCFVDRWGKEIGL